MTLPKDHQPINASQHPFLEIPSMQDKKKIPIFPTKEAHWTRHLIMEARDIVEQKIAHCIYANACIFVIVMIFI